MAIPVGMSLPQDFSQIDLQHLPKLGEFLVGRSANYKQDLARLRNGSRNTHTSKQTQTDLPTALMYLADSIYALADAEAQGAGIMPNPREPRADSARVEPPAQPKQTARNAAANTSGKKKTKRKNRSQTGNRQQTAAPQEPEPAAAEQGEDPPPKPTSKPVGSPVLVRREEARAAHHFRRNPQSHYDKRGGRDRRGRFEKLCHKHPKWMMALATLLVAAIVIAVFLLIDSEPVPKERSGQQLGTLAGTVAEGPEIEQGRAILQAYINARDLKTAEPFIYNYAQIKDKLEQYYEPFLDPSQVSVALKNYAQHTNGQTIQVYTLTEEGQEPRLATILSDRGVYKVHWESLEQVADLNWADFLQEEPNQPKLMRAVITKSQHYTAAYSPQQWQSWTAKDWEGRHILYAFTRKESQTHKRLEAANQTSTWDLAGEQAILAQVRLLRVGSGDLPGLGQGELGEIVEFKAASWLPTELGFGQDFYGKKEAIKYTRSQLPG